ncbi:TPA: Dot/Icm T4SS effector Lem12 [Legionella pneumophila]|nr:Dot/Icm T4SS effector Lem12 [Legionella pneumophila]HAT2031716.1 Dot/Icm T4SS effector Lem12 [Legionella pneumophila]
MQNEKEVKELIQSDKKKRVTWNDNQNEGQIDEKFLKIGTASTPYKNKLDESIAQLMEEGYSEIEATAITGKSVTPAGMVIYNNPVFYKSKESIDIEKANRYNFFSIKNNGLGIVALAAAATVGLVVSKNS